MTGSFEPGTVVVLYPRFLSYQCFTIDESPVADGMQLRQNEMMLVVATVTRFSTPWAFVVVRGASAWVPNSDHLFWTP